MSALPEFSIYALGDSALVLEFEAVIDPLINGKVHALAAWIGANIDTGIIDLVPAYHTLTVHYQPGHFHFEELAQRIRLANISALNTDNRSRRIELPVCYDQRLAPDLAELAQYCGINPQSVIDLHSSAEYRVYFLGFKPGFAYLGGLPHALQMPRKDTPRLAVPAGSVGIGGAQTGIYPSSTPGGWQIIGRTPIGLFNLEHSPPSFLQAGDSLHFRAISYDEYLDLGGT